MVKPLPAGLSFRGAPHAAADIALYVDRTFVDERGDRVAEQSIFDALFELIDRAEHFLVVDQFLFNDFQGPVPETTRALSSELVGRLIARKQASPDLRIVVITDPVNTLYGGRPSKTLDALGASGVEVVITDLRALRDSHMPYSPFWRSFIQWFGNAQGSLLPNPITEGRVSLRTYLTLLNFKANHRKTAVADINGQLVGFVSSANPHDGSSAHDNVAVRFSGGAAEDLLRSENAVLVFSGAQPVAVPDVGDAGDVPSGSTVQLLTESEIRDGLLETLNAASTGDQVDVMVFYLSHSDLLDAMVDAHGRGARVRVLLDPNKDAFGREKNGIPNRASAHRLTRAGVTVRWCATRGEQCHAKVLLLRPASAAATLVTGSANFTRRNLDDYNLETDVRIVAPASHPAIARMAATFDAAWSNTDGIESTGYETYADDSGFRRFLAWWMERTGMGTF
ncbi:MAG: phospholipase D-like domain-containing protein [Pseudomonadota bacterium]